MIKRVIFDIDNTLIPWKNEYYNEIFEVLKELNTEEINWMIKEFTEGRIPDYQMSAMTMAICFQGMDKRETFDLTMAMRDSGDVLDLSRIDGIKVDKHSTGGVGDKVSLVLTPIVASLGVPVAKMSGRGLGHTGGTIDKLESFSGFSTEICFVIFSVITLAIIYAGVRNGIERVSKFMMPILVVLSVIIAIYSVTRPGALAGVKYFLVPNPANFSWMTVVTAMGQMFYSLSIAMGILITFGSYMKKETSIEGSTKNVEIFDTAIAIMAGLMIIPAGFAFSGGDPDTLQAGPALMFITIPKVFANMGLGTFVGILFFLLVLFAAVTSSIALTESAVSTFEDELGWNRRKSTVLVGVIMIALGSLSSLGYGPLANIRIIGMQFLDFFDFLTNSVMMPVAALMTSLLVSRVIGIDRMEEEILHGEGTFRRKKIFVLMIKYLCPVFTMIILASSVANAFGWISM